MIMQRFNFLHSFVFGSQAYQFGAGYFFYFYPEACGRKHC